MEIVPTNAAFQVQAIVKKVDTLLGVDPEIGEYQKRTRLNPKRHPPLPRIQSHIHLIVVKVTAHCHQRPGSEDVIEVQILRVGTFLTSRIVLLDAVSSDRIIEKESKVGVEIKQRASKEYVGFKAVAIGELLPVIARRSA